MELLLLLTTRASIQIVSSNVAMTVSTIAELLDQAGKFERRLERYFAEIRDSTADNGVRLLTYSLARRSSYIQQVLDELGHDEMEAIRATRLDRGIDFLPEKEFPLLGSPPDSVTGTRLLTAVIKYSTFLTNLYRGLIEEPIPAGSVRLLTNLVLIEDRDTIMLKKMSSMDSFL